MAAFLWSSKSDVQAGTEDIGVEDRFRLPKRTIEPAIVIGEIDKQILSLHVALLTILNKTGADGQPACW
jgi:hypothetical protein